MSFIWYILIGITAGYIAAKIMRGSGFGLILNLILGIIGGLVGGWLFNVLGVGVNLNIWGSLITATIGAIALLLIASLFSKK